MLKAAYCKVLCEILLKLFVKVRLGHDTIMEKYEGPLEGPQKPLDRWLEEVANTVWGGYCQLQIPWKPALAALSIRGTVTGHRLGALEVGGGYLTPFQRIPAPRTSVFTLSFLNRPACERRRGPCFGP